jgi:PAS domain S-box-containing protein
MQQPLNGAGGAPLAGLAAPATLAHLLDLLPAPVWVLSVDRRYGYANAAFAQLLGLELTQLVGRTDAELQPDSDHQARAERDLAALQTQGPQESSESFVGPNGQVLKLRVTRLCIREAGLVTGLLCCATLPEERSLRTLSMEQTVRQQCARLGHELRTAVSGLVGLTAILGTADNLTATQRSMLTSAQRCASHLLELSNGMLDMPDSDAAPLSMALRLTPVRPLLQDVVDWVRPRLEMSQVLLQLRVDPAVPDALRLDALRLRQVVLNLISNAVRHTDRGFVAVRLEPAAWPSGQKWRGTEKALRWRLEIEDSGVGIAPSDLELLFDVRRPRQPLTLRDAGGAGLGLNICSEIVSAMGGSLRVRSQLGKGTLFWFEFEAEECVI